MWFWQETATNEVDFVVGSESDLRAIEVKPSATFSRKWFKSMKVFIEVAGVDAIRKAVVYAGDESVRTSEGRITSWKDW